MITERRFVTSRPSVYGKLIAPNRTNEYFPKISTEGLYVYVDPSNPHSYIGTGNSITNLGIGTQALSKGGGTGWENFYGGSWLNAGSTPTGVLVGNDSAIDPSANDVTVFLWAYSTVIDNTFRAYILKGSTPAGSSWRIDLSYISPNRLQLSVGAFPSANNFSAPNILNRWACITYIRSGTLHTAYIDTSSVASITRSLTSSADSWAFGTANYFSANTSMSGYMGIGAIYNRAFTNNEIYEWYEATRQRYLT